MDVDQVRSFNRTVTERIGALQDSYLAAAARSAPTACCGRSATAPTCGRCGPARLDSGYLSRLVASLQREGLVETAPGADKRVRAVTPDRRRPRRARVLDRAATSWREALLAPLSDAQRERLVEAMATVERLLTAGLVEIAVEDPASADAQYCLGEYYKELDARFDGGFQLAPDAAGRRRGLPRRPPARRPGRLRRDQARHELHQAHVGLPHHPRARPRAADAERARAAIARPASRAWRPTAT